MKGKKLNDKTARDALLMDLKINLVKQLLVKQIPKEKVRVLVNFLRYYVRFENPEINTKFEEQVEILTERSNTLGIEELLLDRAEKKGMEKGMEKGMHKKGHDVVENLIIKLGLSDEQAADIAEVSIDFVAKVRAGLKK